MWHRNKERWWKIRAKARKAGISDEAFQMIEDNCSALWGCDNVLDAMEDQIDMWIQDN
ncbi:hypothetical protein [uncultured Sneathiella sp.]|uniref:hypothetical protein n=1 Tax=uncultured Sneathiella sp. TaxID=879315 RepID=UPI002597E0E5|nr:hypothetical protein [uncultured Sneathiella sp.]